MSEDIYRKLAKVLDTLPNGFPATEEGIEIKLLKKMFEPDEAELFCDLKLKFETVDDIAKRTGRPAEELAQRLNSMWERGLVFGVELGGVKLYKMMPWVFGLYEFHIKRMDREFVELCEAYAPYFGEQFFNHGPSLMRVVPIEKEISAGQQALPYESVSAIIENGLSFGVNDCICKKEQRMIGKGCDKPLEVCLAIAPVPNVFDNSPLGLRVISKEEAYDILKKSEEAGLVHLTANQKDGQFFICNCCGCCCGVLRAINEMGVTNAVESNYYARIDPDECIQCGLCAEERCQVHAIEETEEGYRVIREKCIGCGLCVSTCPSEAIRLYAKKPEERIEPPANEEQWFMLRGKARGVDFSRFM
ncbi:MAG: 4Fe-4S ferredoxin [Desulfococcus sp. 4484_241]|nr:MAG: 4Fe-4S ferredoxin [Desulfococcus sp. 4484_241]